MTELVDASIAELRAIHDRLAGEVAGLTADQLTAQSGAEDWTIADVLSHLGSGAEIGRYPVVAAAGASEDPPSHQQIWDRWNALPPAEQAEAFVSSDEKRDGIETRCTRSAPRASTQSAAVTAESIPPETATTMSWNPFFST